MKKKSFIYLCCMVAQLVVGTKNVVAQNNLQINGKIFLNTENRPVKNYYQFLRIDSLNADNFGILFLSNYMENLDFITFANSKLNPDFYKNNPNGPFYLFYRDKDELFVFTEYDISFWFYKRHRQGNSISSVKPKQLSNWISRQDKFIEDKKKYILSLLANGGDLRQELLKVTEENFRIQFDAYKIVTNPSNITIQSMFTKNLLSNDALMDMPKRTYLSVDYDKIEATIIGRDTKRNTPVDKTNYVNSGLATSLHLDDSLSTGLPLGRLETNYYWLYAGTKSGDVVYSDAFNIPQLKNFLKDSTKKDPLVLQTNVLLRRKYPVYNPDSSNYTFGKVNGIVMKGYQVRINQVVLIPANREGKLYSIWLHLQSVILPEKKSNEYKKGNIKMFLEK